MLRWLTAGESHGPAMIGVLEGVPAGVGLATSDIVQALARRRLGYGRGAQQPFEHDQARLVGGVRHGLTQGGPVAVEVVNTDWPKWEQVMASDTVDVSVDGAVLAPLTRPRPGHADLVGMRKYGFDDARPVAERASARETTVRVALGTVAARLLEQAAGVRLVSHVVAIGTVKVPERAPAPDPDDAATLDADPVRCFHAGTSAAMVDEIDVARSDGDTLGGVVEVLAYGMPSGLGSYVQSDRRLDARLAAELMGIPAVKGVEIGDGFANARRRGSVAHDEIEPGLDGRLVRRTNRAGGIEGGMSDGETLRVRAATKPISTVPRALNTVDVVTGEVTKTQHQRSNVCVVAPTAIISEAMVALVLAQALLEKTGGDSLGEVRRNLRAHFAAIPRNLR